MWLLLLLLLLFFIRRWAAKVAAERGTGKRGKREKGKGTSLGPVRIRLPYTVQVPYSTGVTVLRDYVPLVGDQRLDFPAWDKNQIPKGLDALPAPNDAYV